MAKILAGRFDTHEQAEAAVNALKGAGFGTLDVTSFYVNPPGQHAQYPIGGDAHHDEGTKEAGPTAARTAALGAAAGLALGTAAGAAIGGPGLVAGGAIAGAGVGGYVGALGGGLKGSRAGDPSQATLEEPVEGPAGAMVVVCISDARAEDQAVQVLRAQGAQDIERAEGEWRDGAWVDFDPRRTRQLLDDQKTTENADETPALLKPF